MDCFLSVKLFLRGGMMPGLFNPEPLFFSHWVEKRGRPKWISLRKKRHWILLCPPPTYLYGKSPIDIDCHVVSLLRSFLATDSGTKPRKTWIGIEGYRERFFLKKCKTFSGLAKQLSTPPLLSLTMKRNVFLQMQFGWDLHIILNIREKGEYKSTPPS